jgi:hypothetical protein
LRVQPPTTSKDPHHIPELSPRADHVDRCAESLVYIGPTVLVPALDGTGRRRCGSLPAIESIVLSVALSVALLHQRRFCKHVAPDCRVYDRKGLKDWRVSYSWDERRFPGVKRILAFSIHCLDGQGARLHQSGPKSTSLWHFPTGLSSAAGFWVFGAGNACG